MSKMTDYRKTIYDSIEYERTKEKDSYRSRLYSAKPSEKSKVRFEEQHQERTKKSNIIMNKVINDIELSEDEVIDSKFNQYLKNNIKDFDPDLYLDYLIKVNNIESMSEIEFDQLTEVFNYFIKSLIEKLEKLRYLNYDNDEDFEIIKNIFVSGDENYDESYIEKRGNLLRSKIKRITDQIEEYRTLINIIKSIKEEDYSAVKGVKPMVKKTISNDYDFISDFYNNIVTISKVKAAYVDGLMLGPQTIKTYKEGFSKRLIKKD